MDYFKIERKWVAVVPVVVIVISVSLWFATRETLPKTIRIATAHEGGLYHEFGEALEKSLEARTGRNVEIVETEGSVENAQLLREGKVELAIVQGGADAMEGLAVIAPLYPEVLHVVIRSDSSFDSMGDLAGHRVVSGSAGSGMRASAKRVLEHYGITDSIISPTEHYFEDMVGEDAIDAALVTTGLMNRDLQSMLASGRFRLLPVESAEAIATKDPFFTTTRIPRGFYREGSPIPEVDLSTVATKALLVVGENESELLIGEVMEAIYDEGLGLKFPTLISRSEAIPNSPLVLHRVSRAFFNPPDHIGRMAQVMETLAAFKELSVALVAGLYLFWNRRKQLKEAREAEMIQEEKDKLDVFLEKTLVIEEAQMKTSNPEELEEFLAQVTRIKLEALTQLTHEELRSDQTFSIFLMQCANLISKIQLRIMQASPRSQEQLSRTPMKE